MTQQVPILYPGQAILQDGLLNIWGTTRYQESGRDWYRAMRKVGFYSFFPPKTHSLYRVTTASDFSKILLTNCMRTNLLLSLDITTDSLWSLSSVHTFQANVGNSNIPQITSSIWSTCISTYKYMYYMYLSADLYQELSMLCQTQPLTKKFGLNQTSCLVLFHFYKQSSYNLRIEKGKNACVFFVLLKHSPTHREKYFSQFIYSLVPCRYRDS